MLKITEPSNDEELSIEQEIIFKGTADDSVKQIELYADDRWNIGKSKVKEGKWSINYKFNTGGTRIIVAKGFNSSNKLIAKDQVWLFLESDSTIDLNMKLTPSFTLGELVNSVTAKLKSIDNTPTLGEIDNLRKLCTQILQPARDALGIPINISSGFRSEALNREVGGASNSDHRLGFAADASPSDGDTRRLAKWVIDNCQFDQVILEFGTLERPRWIHLSAAPRNRKEILRATNKNGRTDYTHITL